MSKNYVENMATSMTKSSEKIPTLEDKYPNWYNIFNQEYLGVMRVPTGAIIGTSTLKDKFFDDRWVPTRKGIDGRFLRVLAGAYDRGKMFSVKNSPIELIQIGEEYYVSEDGNRRVCVARLLGIDYVEAEIMRLKRN